MEIRAGREHPLDPAAIPPAVRALVDVLAEAGYRACLVGGCVRDLLEGREPAEFDVTTSAPPDRVLKLFPRAIPIGVAHGTVMVPTDAGPVDVTHFRGGPALEDDLGHRDFTVNAIAYDTRDERLVDPWEGRADLAARRLRGVRSARDRLSEDPLRALRAARLVATRELEPEPELVEAMTGARAGLRRIARERVRRELSALLLGAHAGRGLTLLATTGIESDLAPGAAPDAAAVVDALPFDLPVRLAAWLRGTRPGVVLRQLRFPRRMGRLVAHLLRSHPIESDVDPTRGSAVRRAIKRVGEENLAALFALRRAELRVGDAARTADAATARKRFEALEQAIDRVRRQDELALHRFDLALDGSDVMEHLGCGPGPRVGRALAFLTDRVVDDPSCNDPERLRALLDEWREASG